jgi:hypothetical protein
MIKTVEHAYNIEDMEYIEETGSYELYEPEDHDWDNSPSAPRWRVWHVIIMLILLVVAALVLVYGVLPFIASLSTSTSAAQLPVPVQA